MEDIPEEQVIKKLYRAASFAKSPIICPSSFLKLDRVVTECPRCQFSGSVAVQRFPFPAPPMARFMDTGDVFDPKAREAISHRLTQLEKQFPQVRICLCALELPAHVDLREFGFWLFNASPVNEPAEAEKRPWTILLLLDPVIGRVSVTSGYAIEPFVRDDRWETLLRLEREFFFKQDYREAGLRFVNGAEKILREGANRAEMKMGNQMTRKRRRKSQGESGRRGSSRGGGA
ncbi:TPM domain-containing protein [bacterium]|nr:TPM domain-containing protein [bacterium]